MLEIKPSYQQQIDKLLNVAAVLEKIGHAIPEGVYMSSDSDGITLWPDSEVVARKIVGACIMTLVSKPKIEKASAVQLYAEFQYGEVRIRIYGYKGLKCAKVKKTIVHEAQPEKIIPAKEAWVEEIEEMVCEMPAVEAELEKQVEQVPF